MAVETAADRAVFVSVNDFGKSFRYVPSIGPESTLTGIFDAAYLLMEAGTPGVSGTAPTLVCRTDDLQALPMGKAIDGDRIIDGATEYFINDVQPDGIGMTVLIVERSA